MYDKFDWALVPMGKDGFVKLSVVPQAAVRLMLAEAELVKLSEELKAYQKRSEEFRKQGREAKLILRITLLKNIIQDLKGTVY